ncbi:hypothetical protein acdb102_05370 [Acidothermaceae bacterium B102]|nr:hypothetical protein acdb102_05370 [Acidothermaceae bacterium B102]
MLAAGAALGTVGIAVGVLAPVAAEAAAKPADTALAASAEGSSATTREIAAERRSLLQQATAVARVAGATSTTPPKAKKRPPNRPVAKAKPRKLTPREMAKQLVVQHGWSEAQFTCLDELWNRESGWDPHNQNGGSSAYGIPQSLPGSKMAAFGSDWRDNPMTQIRWGLWYIADRYSTPCGAWAHSERYNYY